MDPPPPGAEDVRKVWASQQLKVLVSGSGTEPTAFNVRPIDKGVRTIVDFGFAQGAFAPYTVVGAS